MIPINSQQALQLLDEIVPPHLRSSRHGENYLGSRYAILRRYIEEMDIEVNFLRTEHRTVVNMLKAAQQPKESNWGSDWVDDGV